jgi:hypothetical protein
MSKYSNITPEQLHRAVVEHFAKTPPEEVVRRAEKLTPRVKRQTQRKTKSKKQKGAS